VPNNEKTKSTNYFGKKRSMYTQKINNISIYRERIKENITKNKSI
jgi:hypothetical protein